MTLLKKILKKADPNKKKMFALSSRERKSIIKKATIEANGVQIRTLRKAGYKTS